MQNRKNSRFRSELRYFGPLLKSVKYVPLVFEATGGMGPTAAEEFSEWAKEAAQQVKEHDGGQNYRALGLPHTWNALKFANLYSQMISFSIVKVNALAIVRAVEELARAGGARENG